MPIVMEIINIILYVITKSFETITNIIWNLRFLIIDLFKIFNSLKPLNMIAIYFGIPTIIISVIMLLFKLTNKKQKS